MSSRLPTRHAPTRHATRSSPSPTTLTASHRSASHRSASAACLGLIRGCWSLSGLCLGLLALGCHSDSPPPVGSKPAASASLAATSGQLVEVVEMPWPAVARVQGSLLADEVSTIAARVVGRIVEVNCDLGDTVAAGAQLIRLDDTEYKLKVLQAEAQLAQVRAAIGLGADDPVSQLNPLNSPPVRETKAILDEARQQIARLEKLFAQGAVVATDLEAAQSLERVADARYNSSLNSVREKMALVEVQASVLQLAQQELSDTVILAPLAGVVLSRSAAVGTYVQAGQPIAELAKVNPLRFRGSVPERFAQKLRLGQAVRIALAGRTLQTQIARISPALDPMNRSLVFEADVPNDDNALRSGLFGQAEIVIDDQSTAIVVPSSALVRFAGVDKVWQVADGRVSEVIVQVGREIDGRVEIVEGLTSGQHVLQVGAGGRAGEYGGETPLKESKSELVSSSL